ncbi:MAG: exopolysaccharide biosynthesis polyprenyl glycosylphosphotransferase [Planctomycetes bacterium]|nr:exopolysaccharide biosynthesis polyprenyl glycosylphosphotransferase [Planctomycetota bacterium]
MLRVLQHYIPLRTLLLVLGEGLLLAAVVGYGLTLHLDGLEIDSPAWRRLIDRRLYAEEALEICLVSTLGVVALTQVMLAFGRLYDFWVSASPFKRAARFAEAGGLAIAANLVVFLFARFWEIPRLHDFPGLTVPQGLMLLVATLVVGLALTWLFRGVFHALLRSAKLQLRVVVLGSQGAAHALTREVLQHPEAGYGIVGLVPEAPSPRAEGEDRWITDPNHLPTPATERLVLRDERLILDRQEAAPDAEEPPPGRLRALLQQHGADAVVVAIEDRRRALPTAELLDCRLAGYEVREHEEMYEELAGKIAIGAMRPSYLIFNEGFRRRPWDAVAKRTLDLLAGGLLLVLLLPVMLVTAMLVRITSPGPALFRQERIGLHGKPFTLVKFRSMRPDAERATGPVWATGDDPRITPFGRFMRRTRLDELPQLLNVLGGSMSLVGPRPEREHFIRDLSQRIPYYDQRHVVQPGLTGWAQINHRYGNTEEDALAKLQYDLFYVKNQSLLFDLSILLTTVRTVVLQQGT